MDHLDLRIGFEPGLPGLNGGHQTFGCVAQDGAYPLPTVVLLTREGQPRAFPKTLAVTGTTDGPPALREWLQTSWAPPGPFPPGQPVHGRTTAVPEQWIPADVVHGSGQLTPVQVRVHWLLEFTDEYGHTAQDYTTVTLTFGSTEPEHSKPALKGLPRHIGDDLIFRDFAAVDFGSTSTTVTLFNADEVKVLPIDPEQEGELARALADILDAAAPGPSGAGGTQAGRPAEAARIATAVLAAESAKAADGAPSGLPAPSGPSAPSGQEAVSRLCALLRRQNPDSGLVAATAEELERSARDKGRPWAVHGLEAAYRRAFRVPPLTRLGLSQILFPGVANSNEVSSALTVRDGALYPAERPEGAIRNLKRMLRNPRVVPVPHLGEGVAYPSDDLIALAFVRYLEAVEPKILDPQTDEPRRLAQLVVTSPTTTPPDARARLTRLLVEQVDLRQVVTTYDEGVAAGLFHLMRDFSGDVGAGVETLRARAHPVKDAPRPTWTYTLLIIDVGGGTTDIALIGLTLTDLTDLTDEPPAEQQGEQPQPGAPGPTAAPPAQQHAEPPQPGAPGAPGPTDEPPAEQFSVDGRTYELRPEVLGSTGHPDLGGDYLTLRVYYLLKATLADALLRLAHARRQSGQPATEDPEAGNDPGDVLLGILPDEFATADGPGSLAAEVLDRLAARDLPRQVVDPQIREVLSTVLPTSWDKDASRSGLFYELWAQAEEAKFQLGVEGAKPWTASAATVRSWLGKLPVDTTDVKGLQKYLTGLVPADTSGDFLRLSPADFRRIAEPVFKEAAAVALDIVQSRVHRDRQDGREFVLDRVLLSGRSTMMPVAEEAVTQELAAERLPDGSPLFANVRSVKAEQVYAKRATSLGAAWALSHSRTVLRQGGADDIGGSSATTRVDIHTDDISPTLPCDFEVLGPGNRPAKVLGVGEPYASLQDGVMVVRTGWGPPDRMLSLLRPLNKQVRVNWGHYGVELAAQAQGVQLNPELWWGRLADGVRPRVRMQIEVDQQLAPRVHYRLGDRAHRVVTGPSLDLVDAGLAEPGADGLLVDPELGLSVRGVTRQGRETAPVTVLDAATWRTGERFPEFFRETQDLDAPDAPLPGIILPFTPPRPADEYIVDVTRPDGSVVELGRLAVPSHPRRGDQHVLTLDAHGRIRVHRALLPYLQARDLATVQEQPGTVYSAPLEPGLESPFADWNPFHGRH
ncbi:hypothetical protein ACIQGZ_10855 [Streptomyces sp. NPDC092296]|uniref:hypothetical protein n=1 Tax=Streptomyces sp. NPDC092296 TaxID=3366012 RepID=UPI00382C64CB